MAELKASFDPIETLPSYRRVTLAIEEQIISGRMKIGELLPTENELAEQLGVNRSTVREGLRSLENAGFLKRIDKKRLTVSFPEESEIARHTSRAMSLYKITFSELWETLMALEPIAADLAAQRAGPDDLESLHKNVRETEERLHDDATIIRLDVEFHGLVAQATGNRALVLSERPLSMLLYTATKRLYRGSPRARYRLLEAHRKVVEAIEAGDTDRARVWMTKHIEDFRRGCVVAGLDINRAVSPG